MNSDELYAQAKVSIVARQKNKNHPTSHTWRASHFQNQIKRMMLGFDYDKPFLTQYIESDWNYNPYPANPRHSVLPFCDVLHGLFSIDIPTDHNGRIDCRVQTSLNLNTHASALELLHSFCQKNKNVAAQCFLFLLQSLFQDGDHNCGRYNLSVSGERYHSYDKYGASAHNLANEQEFYYCLSQAFEFARHYDIKDLDTADYLAFQTINLVEFKMMLDTDAQQFLKGSLKLTLDYVSFNGEKKDDLQQSILKALRENVDNPDMVPEFEIELEQKLINETISLKPLKNTNSSYKI